MSPTAQILLIASCVLAYITITEFRQHRIRNEVVLVLLGLYLAFAVINHDWIQLVVHVGFAILVFVPMLYAYSLRMMAGGDLKLFTGATVWVGPTCFLPFIALVTLFIGVQILGGRLGIAALRKAKQGGVPLGPSIATALIATFLTGCLDKSTRANLFSALGQWWFDFVYWLLPSAPHGG